MSIRTLRNASAAATAVAGIALLAAYAFGVQLPAILPPPWASLAILIAAVGLWTSDWEGPARFASVGSGLLASLIGVITWLESILDTSLAFDTLLFPQALLTSLSHPGRPSPMAAFNLMLLGAAIALLPARRMPFMVTRELFAISSITFSYFALVDCAFRLVRGFSPTESMSPVSSTLFILISISLVASRQGGPLHVILRDVGPAGSFARWLMPIPLILPVVTSLVRAGTQGARVVGPRTGTSIFVLADILAAILIVWISSYQVFLGDQKRRKLEQDLLASRDDLDNRVNQRTRELVQANLELERTHRELQQVNLTLTNLIAAAPLGICAFNADGTVRQKNPAAETIFGAGSDALSILFERARQGETVIGTEMTLPGEARPAYLNVWASPMMSPDGQLNGVVVIAADVSEKKAYENRLRHAQKLESLGVLAGGIAHDFNNLLTGILGNASLICETIDEDDPNRVCLDQIIHASQRAAELTRQMLAYAGKGRFVLEMVDMSRMVEEINTMLQISIPKSVNFRVKLERDIPLIEADPSQIQQILMNLVINGAEAIQDSGTVQLTIGTQHLDSEYLRSHLADTEIPPGLYVTLEVSDTGSGMNEEIQARVFEPFFTTKFTGRGLGLAAAQGIVRSHNGALRVQSAVGEGTTFKVWLPAATGRPAGSPPDPLLAFERGRGMILVIDDDPLVRQAAKNSLGSAGYEVKVALTGEEGALIFQRNLDSVRAIVLDLTMPGLNGLETLKTLRRIHPDVPMILSSGFNEDEVTSQFDGTNFTGFIQKPYTGLQLAAKLKAALAAARKTTGAGSAIV